MADSATSRRESWGISMRINNVYHSVVDFLSGMLARDRYLLEALTAMTTFGVGGKVAP